MGLQEANEMIADLWAEIQQGQLSEAVAKAKADPEANKLTRAFDGEMRWRYFDAGTDGRGWKVRFCWSTTRNAAGYFLGWREIEPAEGSKAKFAMKRDQWIARKARHRCKTKALQRTEKLRAAWAARANTK